MMEFIMDNYIWIMIILGVALLACIGYVVDKREKKVKNKKIEELSNEQNVVVPTIEQTPNQVEEVVVQPVEEVIENTEITEQPSVEETVIAEEVVQPVEEVVETPIEQQTEELVQEPQIEEIKVEEMVAPVEEETVIEPALEPLVEEENTESVNITEEVKEPTFEEIESFEPISEEVLEEPVEELTPVEQPRSELTDGSEELLLDGDPTIDQDFQSLLEDEEMEELEVELPPIEETKKEDFKSIDDDDEDLWTF